MIHILFIWSKRGKRSILSTAVLILLAASAGAGLVASDRLRRALGTGGSARRLRLLQIGFLRLGDLFLRMIRGEASEEEIDSLEEASALRDVSHMPARVKCAMLGWRTLSEALTGKVEE